MLSKQEREIFNKGARFLAGVDEAGRGPLAGPVTSAIVVLSQDYPSFLRKLTIKDSKMLSEKRREEVFNKIKESKIIFKTASVSPEFIDKINIFQATLLSWKKCFNKLNPKPDFLFLDGNQFIPNFKTDQKAVVAGDKKIMAISLASIVAKVTRDRYMKSLDKKYPEYGLATHKGYGTKFHMDRLKKNGATPIHRKSFRPVFESMSFKEKVYFITSQIPRGKTMTYKEVAEAIGRPKAFRAVGNALNKNRSADVPCHRVIRSDETVGGFNGGSLKKRRMLEKEGFFTFRDNKC